MRERDIVPQGPTYAVDMAEQEIAYVLSATRKSARYHRARVGRVPAGDVDHDLVRAVLLEGVATRLGGLLS